MIRYRMYDEESGETAEGIAESVLMLTNDDRTNEVPEGRMIGRCNYFGTADKSGCMAETFVRSSLEKSSRPIRMVLMAIMKKMDDTAIQRKLMPLALKDIQSFLGEAILDEDDDEDDEEEVEPLRETRGGEIMLDEFRRMMKDNGFGDEDD
ncbi:MAG: hypothetical protein IKS31_01500 [Clostridia bacterium]|nr:hypothetical protein [Clostridia bacterium]